MKRILVFSLLIVSISSIGQGKALTLEEAMLKARTTLAPENMSQLQFYGSSNDYVFLKDGVWFKSNFETATETTFLTLTSLNDKLRKAGLDTAKTMPAIKFREDGWLMTINGNKLLLDPVIRGYKMLMPSELAAKENAEENSAGFIAYLDNYNLHVSYIPRRDLSNAIKRDDEQVTTDGSRDIVYASSVHREEFGISKGIFWSNSGNQLAFYRMDQSMVTDYPIIDWTQRPAKAELIKYPMAGDKSHHVTVGVYNAILKTTVWLKTGEPAEQYLTNIVWSPDDRFIYLAIVNRAQNHMWLNKYDPTTGNFLQTLFEETDEKYVEPLVPMLFLKNNTSQFVWQSNRDGWNHLYLYDSTGKLLKQLTKGNWEVTDVKGFNRAGDKLFYVSTAVAPIDKNLYALTMKTGVSTPVTTEPAVHIPQVSDDGSRVLDVYSTPTVPRHIQVVDVKKPSALKHLLGASDPLHGYDEAKLSIFTIPNNAGDSIYCRMYRPNYYVEGQKQPVIVYWYGGPHAQMITNSWNGGAGDYWFHYMASQGYVVFTIDTRGSDNRGKAFEQSIFRKLGDAQMEDLMAAVKYLTAQPFVDKDRMGLFGWSFGGFMTTDFMLNHPGIFKAAVAGGPVMNWQYYEIMYGERYMDTPQENPEGYAATDLTKQVSKLKGKLLLIHGLQDPVVVQQNSISFVKACVDKGVQVDYMLYPGHEHNVIGKDRLHLYQKVTDYLVQNLK